MPAGGASGAHDVLIRLSALLLAQRAQTDERSRTAENRAARRRQGWSDDPPLSIQVAGFQNNGRGAGQPPPLLRVLWLQPSQAALVPPTRQHGSRYIKIRAVAAFRYKIIGAGGSRLSGPEAVARADGLLATTKEVRHHEGARRRAASPPRRPGPG